MLGLFYKPAIQRIGKASASLRRFRERMHPAEENAGHNLEEIAYAIEIIYNVPYAEVLRDLRESEYKHYFIETGRLR